MENGRKISPKIKPKFLAQECPVCNGFGSLAHGTKVCYACNGRGYIIINQETGIPVEDGGKDENKNNTY